jgi:hypothetical protein
VTRAGSQTGDSSSGDIRAGLELWAAARVVSEHAAGGRCNLCTGPAGPCRLYRWADRRLRRWEAGQGRRYDGYAPSWHAAATRDPAGRRRPEG